MSTFIKLTAARFHKVCAVIEKATAATKERVELKINTVTYIFEGGKFIGANGEAS